MTSCGPGSASLLPGLLFFPGRGVGAAAACRHFTMPPAVMSGSLSAAATSPRPREKSLLWDSSLTAAFFHCGAWWDLAAELRWAMIMLTAHSHELPVSVLLLGCCKVGILASMGLHVVAAHFLEWCAGIL